MQVSAPRVIAASPARILITLSPFPRRNARGIAKSLDRLAEMTSGPG
jgi:hypothetical protein